MNAFNKQNENAYTFGLTKAGSFLDRLDFTLRTGDVPSILEFYEDNRSKLEKHAETENLFAVALLYTVSLFDDQDEFDRYKEFCFENPFVWKNFPDGHTKKQNIAKSAWLQKALSSILNNCNITSKEKLHLYGKMLIEGEEPYAISHVQDIGLTHDIYIGHATKIAKKAVEIFPEDPHVATALVMLTTDTDERAKLALQMVEIFPTHRKLKRIAEDVNYDQPGWKRPPKPRRPIMYIPD